MLKNDVVAYRNDEFSESHSTSKEFEIIHSFSIEQVHIGSKSILRRKCCTSSSEATVLGWSDVVHWFSDMFARFCTCLWTASELHHFDSIEPDNCTLMLPATRRIEGLRVTCLSKSWTGCKKIPLCHVQTRCRIHWIPALCRSQSTSKVGPLRSLCRQSIENVLDCRTSSRNKVEVFVS